ncbi:hypothetical protein [Acidovorax sp. Leaf73]|uniref:hypothetical protein n=1 Tax=Acidovorax sp. Leaf73 TaxID=2876566 RepID=UPI001E652C0E|nr:hypothetical protein [Acidovorax sp. Leaf73]
MKESSKTLNVAERIGAVIALHKSQYPGVPLSINSLAKQAGVSRSNLYTSHAEVVASLKRHKSDASAAKPAKNFTKIIDELERELKLLKKTNKALLLLNGALRTRIGELDRRLKDIGQQSGKRR